MTALGILFIVLSIAAAIGVIYVELDKKHFKDKEI